MRLKNNPKAKEALATCSFCLDENDNVTPQVISSFSNNNPIFIEIGCGKGQFILELARRNPDNFYFGIEQYDSVLYSAIKKCGDNPPDNLRFLCKRAENLPEIFGPESIDTIYLNFSDPWPKKRHSKRRLTSSVFLNLYSQVLKPDGLIIQKTDNRDLFEFSLESFQESPLFDIEKYSLDIYSDNKLLEGNIPTEYEEKFRSKGQPIYYIRAFLRKH